MVDAKVSGHGTQLRVATDADGVKTRAFHAQPSLDRETVGVRGPSRRRRAARTNQANAQLSDMFCHRIANWFEVKSFVEFKFFVCTRKAFFAYMNTA